MRIGTDIGEAVRLLKQGEVVALPTETVYGLAGSIFSEGALRKIFSVKNRPFTDPLIVHVPDVASAERLVLEFPPLARRLMEAFSPGPLTVLLPRSPLVPALVTNGSPWVAIRIPAHPVAQAVLKALGEPLAAPSANPFGGISPTTAVHVASGLGEKIPYILDGGPCEVGVESTIVKLVDHERIQVLRQGGIPEEDLQWFARLESDGGDRDNAPVVPGNLLSHYAPRKPLLMEDQANKILPGARIGWLRFFQKSESEAAENQVYLSSDGNLSEAARNLFSALHELDEKPVDVLVAEWLPETGLGRAINDRLRRASARGLY